MQTLGNTRYRKLPGKTISREPKVHVTPYNVQNMRMCVCTVCVCVYIYTHILFYICVHIYIYICTYIHIYIHAFIHTYILYHTCISVHIYIMVNTYICIFFCTHTEITEYQMLRGLRLSCGSWNNFSQTARLCKLSWTAETSQSFRV